MTADEVSTDTARRQAEVLLPVRVRPGVVGESRRVVHQAVLVGGVYRARCGAELSAEVVEVTAWGAPCVPCVARASLNLPAADRAVGVA